MIAIIALIAFCIIDERRSEDACVERGGTYQSYNCHTTYVPISYGNGWVITPEEDCDHRCVEPNP